MSSRSLVVAGREDFTFNIDGGAGNDSITLKLIKNDIATAAAPLPLQVPLPLRPRQACASTGQHQNWYNNQDLNNNVTGERRRW